MIISLKSHLHFLHQVVWHTTLSSAQNAYDSAQFARARIRITLLWKFQSVLGASHKLYELTLIQKRKSKVLIQYTYGEKWFNIHRGIFPYKSSACLLHGIFGPHLNAKGVPLLGQWGLEILHSTIAGLQQVKKLLFSPTGALHGCHAGFSVPTSMSRS